jgi:hypothetical protein
VDARPDPPTTADFGEAIAIAELLVSDDDADR